MACGAVMSDLTHADLAVRLDKADQRFGNIDTKLDNLIMSVNNLSDTIEPIHDDIMTIKEMTTGWRALGALGQFIKWSSGIALGIVAVWALLKAMAKGLLG
jgi:hypothetical protein